MTDHTAKRKNEKQESHTTASTRHTVEFHPETESVVECVVFAVAAVENTKATELPAMYEYIDPDALNKLFDAPDSDIAIFFNYADYEIRVESVGTINITTFGE